MEITMITLLLAAIILIIVSFFKNDRNKEVEQQIENFSITLMQEIYQLKKKVTVLEEEILIGQDARYFTNDTPSTKSLDRDKVLSLYEEGYSLEEITKLTGVDRELIDELLREL